MKNLHRNKRTLYICNVYQDEKLKKYKEPIKIKENWQHIDAEAEFKNIGLEVYDYIQIKTDKSHSHYYHLGDRLYINVEPPEEHDVMCKTADYEVYNDPILSLNECKVVLKKLSGRNGSKNIF